MDVLTEDRGQAAGSPAVLAAESGFCPPLLLVIEENQTLSRAVGYLCEYLGVQIEHVGGQRDLRALLAERRPIAILAPADAPDRDGSRVLKHVAEYDRDLPVMLVVGRNPAQLDQIRTIEASLNLNSVRKTPTIPGIGDLADFLSEAGKRIARWSADGSRPV